MHYRKRCTQGTRHIIIFGRFYWVTNEHTVAVAIYWAWRRREANSTPFDGVRNPTLESVKIPGRIFVFALSRSLWSRKPAKFCTSTLRSPTASSPEVFHTHARTSVKTSSSMASRDGRFPPSLSTLIYGRAAPNITKSHCLLPPSSSSLDPPKPMFRKRPLSGCVICATDDDHGSLLVCEACEVIEFHLYCLTPRLGKVPPGKWLCPACEGREKEAEEVVEEKVSLVVCCAAAAVVALTKLASIVCQNSKSKPSSSALTKHQGSLSGFKGKTLRGAK